MYYDTSYLWHITVISFQTGMSFLLNTCTHNLIIHNKTLIALLNFILVFLILCGITWNSPADQVWNLMTDHLSKWLRAIIKIMSYCKNLCAVCHANIFFSCFYKQEGMQHYWSAEPWWWWNTSCWLYMFGCDLCFVASFLCCHSLCSTKDIWISMTSPV